MRQIWPLVLATLLLLAGCGAPAGTFSGGHPAPAPAPVTVLVAGQFGGLSAIALPSAKVSTISTSSPVLAMANGALGSTVLVTGPSAQPPAGNLGLLALSWQRSSGKVGLFSLAFTTPHQGSMFTGDGFTELSGIVGTVGTGPIALNAFHGGGIGEIFAVLGPNLAPLANYRLPSHLTPSNLVLEGSMSGPPCQSQALAFSAASGAFLVRGTVSASQGFSCRYLELSPGGTLTALSGLTRFAAGHPLAAAAISPSGDVALLTVSGQLFLASSLSAAPALRANLGLSGVQSAQNPNPSGLYWSPHSHQLVATIGGKLALYQVGANALRRLAETTLPAGSQSALAVFGPRFSLPTSAGLEAAIGSGDAVAQNLELVVPGTYNTAPQVHLAVRSGARSQCIPLGGWVGSTGGPPLATGMATADGCPEPAQTPWFGTGLGYVLVPPGAHPSSGPAVQSATAHGWLVMPKAGWMETGTYQVQATLGSFRISRTVTVGP